MAKTKKPVTYRFVVMCLFIGLLPLIVTAVTITSFATYQLRKNITSGVEKELLVAAEQLDEHFTYELAENGDVDYDKYSDHAYLESLQGDEIELTLFKDDTRLITSLKNTDGSYNEGTQANADIYAAVKAGATYEASDVMINGTAYMVCYVPIYDGEGNFWGMAFAGEPQTQINTTTSNVTKNLIFIVCADVLVFTLLIVLISWVDAKPIKKAVISMNGLAEGNLNEEFSNDSQITEFRDLIGSGILLKEKLGQIIGGAKDTAETLGTSVASVDELSKNSADGTTQIAQAVNELATTAQSMAETVQDANAAVINMGEIIDEITSDVDTMVNVSGESYEANMKAVEAMDVLKEASDRSAESVEAIRAQILETNKAIDEVGTAADTISSISSETNLLALNASIEAARAGEAGRGFAVVAENIGKLAEESSTSAGQIQNIINRITELSEKSVEMANKVGAIVENQKAALEDAYQQMDATKTSGIKLREGVQGVGRQAESLAGIKAKVMNDISDLSAISEENAASSEEVSASVENIASAVEGTKDESAKMKDQAEELASQMAYFKNE